MRRVWAALGLAVPLAGALPVEVSAADLSPGQRLVAAYPEHLSHVEGNTLVWRDGTRMVIDDGEAAKPFEQWLARPDLKDMLAIPYLAGRDGTPPAVRVDPGRARHAAFFARMYGDCSRGEVTRHLVDVVWLPTKARQVVKATRINGVADRLAVVSQELDRLPRNFDAFLVPSAGTYNCRRIAGTAQASAHGHGIAIDIAVARTDYWRWNKPDAAGTYRWKSRIPWEIVEIFEKHGFIWGGKWYHYDTMHFEYRPELLLPRP